MNDRSVIHSGSLIRDGTPGVSVRPLRADRRLRILPVLLACLAMLSGRPAQGLDPHRAVSQFHLRSWDRTAGYPAAEILAIHQGPRGYLWLGTAEGLARFDGVRFDHLRFDGGFVSLPSTPPGDASAPQVSWIETAPGPATELPALWIGTRDGLFVLEDEIEGALRRPTETIAASLGQRRILCLLKDSTASSWIGTNDGLYRLQRGRLEGMGGAGLEMRALALDPEGTLRIATRAGVVMLPASGFEAPSRAQSFEPQGLQGLGVEGFADTGHRLWAATNEGVYRLGNGGWERRSRRGASLLLADRHGTVWAAMDEQLIAFRDSEESTSRDRLDLGGGAIQALYEDRQGTVWVATETSLFSLEDGELVSFTQREGLPARSVRTVLESSTSRKEAISLWVGTDGGGIANLQEGSVIQTYSTADGLASNAVLSLAETPPGTLWIGTADAGLSRLQSGAFTTLNTADGLPGDSVTALLTDRAGDLWIGTLGGGLGRLRGSRFESFTAENSDLASDFVRSLRLAADGAVLVGTENGLSRWQDDRLETIAGQEILAGDLVLSVLDDGNRLWIGTNAGLVLLEGGKTRVFDRSHGLLSETVHQIQRDEQRLWLCTNKGLFGLSMEELQAVGEGQRTTVVPLRPRGSESHECNGYSQPASLRTLDGRFWFSALDGLLALRPEDLRPDPLPEVIVEKLVADGLSQSLEQPVRLSTSVRTIDLQISASSLRSADRQSFQYRLANYSPLWTNPSRRRSMRYTNLGPGTYRFEARAVHPGHQEGSVTSLLFEIPRPFYGTTAFAMGVLLLLVVLGRGLYHLRLQQILQRTARLSEKVIRGTSKVLEQKQELDRAHQRLASTNEKLRRANEQLFELDRENTDLLALAAHGLRGPLLNLQGFSAETERALEKLQAVAEEVRHRLPEAEWQGLQSALFEETPEALTFIRASTDRMDQLIQAILTLASLGRQKLAPRPLDTEELVRDILRSLSFQVSRSGARVALHPLPEIVADHHAMRLVFENLLHNAILYLSPDRPGQIEVRSDGDEEIVIFQIQDNGIGIEPRNKDLIFKLFGRVAGRDVPGEGMGLAYVRTVLERQGGKIWFHSIPGQGTTFSFSMPRVASEDPEGEDES